MTKSLREEAQRTGRLRAELPLMRARLRRAIGSAAAELYRLADGLDDLSTRVDDIAGYGDVRGLLDQILGDSGGRRQSLMLTVDLGPIDYAADSLETALSDLSLADQALAAGLTVDEYLDQEAERVLLAPSTVRPFTPHFARKERAVAESRGRYSFGAPAS